MTLHHFKCFKFFWVVNILRVFVPKVETVDSSKSIKWPNCSATISGHGTFSLLVVPQLGNKREKKKICGRQF